MTLTTGIPGDIAQKIYWVKDDKRNNPLSHQLGGVVLVIVFTDKRVFGYDKIKFPSRYIEVAMMRELKKPINDIYMSKYIDSIFIRTDENLPFEQVWYKGNVNSIKVALQEYDINNDIFMDESLTDQDVQDWGYDSLDDFWDSIDTD